MPCTRIQNWCTIDEKRDDEWNQNHEIFNLFDGLWDGDYFGNAALSCECLKSRFLILSFFAGG